MSPELGRFLQTDPIGFKGDASNLYRYFADDPVNRTDPDGTIDSWSRLMWLQGSSSFSLDQFDALKQLQAAAGKATDALAARIAKLFGGDSNGKEKQAVKPGGRQPASIRREVVRPYYTTFENNGHTFYRAHTIWRLTLLDGHQKATFGEGILVNERINGHSNAVDFVTSGPQLGSHSTYPGGWVPDEYHLTYSSPNGKVTTQQTMLVGGREANWEATTNALGQQLDGTQYWAPFH